jgi:hypothetical protein
VSDKSDQPEPVETSQTVSKHGGIVAALFGWSGWTKVASMVTAVGTLFALWFSGQSLRATHDQYGLSAQAQVADRFTKSIEQLGSDKPEIILGGIYSLERLARDSSVDRPVVVEVLGAYLRSHAPFTSDDCDLVWVDGYRAATGALPIDIQAALTVLARREVTDEATEEIDLSGTCLPNAELFGANFVNGYFFHIDWPIAHLESADLTDALFDDSKLEGLLADGADLIGARMNGVEMDYAHLRGGKSN